MAEHLTALDWSALHLWPLCNRCGLLHLQGANCAQCKKWVCATCGVTDAVGLSGAFVCRVCAVTHRLKSSTAGVV